MSDWTNVEVALLIQLADDGLSAAEIAAHLKGKSRNAVIGKVHRLGIELKRKPPAKGSTHKYPTPRRFIPKQTNEHSKELPPENVIVKREDGIEFINLKETQCRWPFGKEAEMYFCGRPKAEHSESYCLHHEHASRWHPRESKNEIV